ncbi:MAG TPA: hypothetical protein VLX92_34750 [Kofleriaceae bacterium]|nr:hypothetical protein [Kofleriaceae bacterium]
MRWALLAILASCYTPRLEAGSPCSETTPCPPPLVCAGSPGMCVTGLPPDAGLADTMPPDDSALDASLAPGNDLPAGATPITGSMTITEDVTYAHDDASGPTSGNGTMFCDDHGGGRDVYFTITIPADEVWYLDTFGSTYDTLIRVYNGPCATGPAPTGAICHDNECSTTQTQWLDTVQSGDNCVVVDEDTNGSPSTSPAMLVLHVERGNRNGTRLASGASIATTGDTCHSSSVSTGSCGGAGAKDDAYYATSCPSTVKTLDATTCDAATAFDTVLYARRDGTELACNNDDTACSTAVGASTISGVKLGGPHLFWLIVDGGSATACGAYTLTTTLQ